MLISTIINHKVMNVADVRDDVDMNSPIGVRD